MRNTVEMAGAGGDIHHFGAPVLGTSSLLTCMKVRGLTETVYKFYFIFI